jgi:membrane protease YdiL (CAAX protease family)
MEPTLQPEYRSPIARLGTFLRDFLPEQNLQFLFPLGSFLLLLGAKYAWYIASNVLARLGAAGGAALFARPDPRLLYLCIFAGLLAHFAFFASVVLWCLPVGNVLRKFGTWVLFPLGFATVTYLVVLVSAVDAGSVLDTKLHRLYLSLRAILPDWTSVGLGVYGTLVGLALLGVGLRRVRAGTLRIPWRFATNARGDDTTTDAPDRSPNVFVFWIATTIAGFTISWLLPYLGNISANLERVFLQPQAFPTIYWLIEVATAGAAVCLALILTGRERWRWLLRLFKNVSARECLVAASLSLFAVLAPRLFLKVSQEFTFYARGLESGGFPTPWSELFVPGPLPWVAVAYVLALLCEISLRGYLQAQLEERFGLKRAILLIGLLWTLLPLQWRVAQTIPYGVFPDLIPGGRWLALFVMLIIYSIPLGWMYARTRSVIPVTIMHGTIVMFHAGAGEQLHFNHPELYAFEMALWIFIGWYLFKKYPLEGVESPREPEVAPA